MGSGRRRIAKSTLLADSFFRLREDASTHTGDGAGCSRRVGDGQADERRRKSGLEDLQGRESGSPSAVKGVGRCRQCETHVLMPCLFSTCAGSGSARAVMASALTTARSFIVEATGKVERAWLREQWSS